MTEQVRVRLNLESNKDTTGTREAKHTAEYRDLVGDRAADTTAAVSITAEAINRKVQEDRMCQSNIPALARATGNIGNRVTIESSNHARQFRRHHRQQWHCSTGTTGSPPSEPR